MKKNIASDHQEIYELLNIHHLHYHDPKVGKHIPIYRTIEFLRVGYLISDRIISLLLLLLFLLFYYYYHYGIIEYQSVSVSLPFSAIASHRSA